MSDPPLTFRELEARRKEIEAKLRSKNDTLSLRMRRSISWGLRGEAEQSRDDLDAAFIFYWIAFNAVYEDAREEHTDKRARERIDEYLARIVLLDRESAIYRKLWEEYEGQVRELLENKYVYEPFWKQRKYWKRSFDDERKRARRALNNGNTRCVLKTVFNRLYVLRNQLVHGGATWGGSVNREQVRGGANILAFLTRCFIGLMLDNPKTEWGAAYYPVVSD